MALLVQCAAVRATDQGMVSTAIPPALTEELREWARPNACNNDWRVFQVYALGVMVGGASSAICRDTSGSATSARSSAASCAASTSAQT